MQNITNWNGPAGQLVLLISAISQRVYGQVWLTDIEWAVRAAMDDGTLALPSAERDQNQPGLVLIPTTVPLEANEISNLQALRAALADGWVHLHGAELRRWGGPRQGNFVSVTRDEWESEIAKEDYRLRRYTVV